MKRRDKSRVTSVQISDDMCRYQTISVHLLDIAHFLKRKILFMKHCQILDLRIIVQNCKIGTSTVLTSSTSDVAWKRTIYRAKTSAEICHFQI